MSELTFAERQYFERLFGMSSGYVLDFSNRTFAEFIRGSVGINIDDPKYLYDSGSKANRLRAFWNKEPNHLVGKLLKDMVQYAASLGDKNGSILLEQCQEIVDRLLRSAPVPEIDVITPNAPGRSFEALAKSIRESIENNEPAAGLDRLHTFVLKYVRAVCEKHDLPVDREKPLHSVFGEYVKFLKNQGKLVSSMSERILKSCISTLEAFNDVRNNQSFAHDNELLNYAESILIFNHVTAAIRFIEAIEAPVITLLVEPSVAEPSTALNHADEIPF